MLCNSALEQAEATDKFYTVLEPWGIGDKDPKIKIQLFGHRSQERPLCLQKDTYGCPILTLLICKLEESVLYQFVSTL